MKEYIHDAPQILSGEEKFSLNGMELNISVLDFWRFQFSNLSDMQGEVGEFIVSCALYNTTPDNKCGWTQYDIDYNGLRVEVKSTAYYQPWRLDGSYSEQRTFSIRKAHEKEGDITSPLVRNNDIYVFVLNTGKNKDSANPLNLNNFLFWVVPTKYINDKCNDNKTLSLKRLCGFDRYNKPLSFSELKGRVDFICGEIKADV